MRSRLRSMQARTRLAISLCCGAAAVAVVALVAPAPYVPTAGWDAAAAIYALTLWSAIGSMDAAATRTHATAENPGKAVSDGILVGAALASVAGVAALMVEARQSTGTTADVYAGMALVSIALSWIAVQSVFTVRYASQYYGGASRGGIGFNQDEDPRYADFAYLAFTIGMCFQVSDTSVQSSAIRSSVLRQALICYLFGTVILASAINLVVGLGTS